MLRFSVIAAVLALLVVPAEASFVFDNFTTPGVAPQGGTPLGNGVTRLIGTSGVAAPFDIAVTTAATATWTNVFGNNQINLTYNFANKDLYSIDRILRATVGAGTTGLYQIVFRVVDSASPAVIYSTVFNNVAAGATLNADTHSFISNGAAGSSANTFQVIIKRQGGNGGGIGAGTAGQFFLTGGLSAVPEPTSLLLLGAVMVPGYFIARRRKALVA